MKKKFFIFIAFVSFIVLFSGCSMMPDDEEIIKGSVLETEIFGDEFIDDEGVADNDENFEMDDEEGDDNVQGKNDNFLEDDEDSDLDNEIVDVM